MFIEFFNWFCNSLKEVFTTMDKFILFDNFSFFDFSCGLLATSIIFKLLKLIMLIEDEEVHYSYTSNYMDQYDVNYKPKHRASYRYEYIPKHEPKGRHGKL